MTTIYRNNHKTNLKLKYQNSGKMLKISQNQSRLNEKSGKGTDKTIQAVKTPVNQLLASSRFFFSTPLFPKRIRSVFAEPLKGLGFQVSRLFRA
jgi:hypothetical protein